MKPFLLRNGRDHAVQMLMEPSGHCLEMPPGAEFVVVPAPYEVIKIHHDDPDVMVEGFLSRVTHNGELLASWSSDTDKVERSTMLSSREELGRHLLAQGERIFAQPDGHSVYRDLGRKSWMCQIRWADEQQALYINGSPGITAAPECEAALAVTMCRINSETALPGFRLMPATPSNPKLGIVYTVVLMLDHEQRIASSVVDRGLTVCFHTVAVYARRFEAVAAGAPDPGVP